MKTLGFIGNFCGDAIGGQAEKTRVLYKKLEEKFHDIFKVDVYGQNPLQLFFHVWKLFRKCDCIVIILASPGYFKIQTLIVMLKWLMHTEIYEFVIGGVRQEYLERKTGRINREKKVDKIYVEAEHMVEAYKRMGISNAVYIPNFKDINGILDLSDVSLEKTIKRFQTEGLKLCTFSRIDRYKGIDTAIKIVKTTQKISSIAISLDIIGPVDGKYETTFGNLIDNFENTSIQYKGSVPSNEAIETLKNYDALIFPTHWKTEGFPGTFIDAMAAGLPILATNRENFGEIIKNGYNGWLIDEWDVAAYAERIRELAENPKKLIQMKKNSVNEVKKYDAENALWKVIKDLEQ